MNSFNKLSNDFFRRSNGCLIKPATRAKNIFRVANVLPAFLILMTWALLGGSARAQYAIFSNLGDAEGDTTAPLCLDGGTLYGIAAGNDGELTDGGFFKLGSTGTPSLLASLSSGTTGFDPFGGLTVASDGNFYGTAYSGGPSDFGTVFQILSSNLGQVNRLHPFTQSGADGAGPLGNLVQASNGYLYGITQNGGEYTEGCIYKISTSGSYSTVYSFDFLNTQSDANPDGAFPQAGLVLDNGVFYGTTSGGGLGNGIVFSFNPSTLAYSIVYEFGTVANDGANPQSALVVGSDGALYGTTTAGGLHGQGVIFRINSSGYSVFYNFGSVASDGDENSNGLPGDGVSTAALFSAPNGGLYGTTQFGGTAGYGVLFEITLSGTYAIIHNFGDGSVNNDGLNPHSGLILGPNGYLYGTTPNGGTDSRGTVYQYQIPDSSLFFQNGTSLGLLTLNSTFLPRAWQGIGAMSSGWQQHAVGDMHGDGVPDIFFQNGTSIGALILNSSGAATSWVGIGAMNSGWELRGAGHITGDGNLDLIFQDGTLLGYLEINTSGQPVSWTGIGAMGAGWELRAVADLTGDGQPDLLFQNGTALGALQVATNGTPTAWNGIGAMSSGWILSAAVDVIGDNQPALIFQNGTSLGGLTVNTSFQPVAWYGIGAVGSGWTLPGDY